MQIYTKRILQFQKELTQLNGQSKKLSLARFLLFVGCVVCFYFGFAKENIWGWLGLLLLLILFFISIHFHGKLKYRIQIQKNLIDINKKEIAYLQNGILNFPNGKEFLNTSHHHSFDLDLFGTNSLYQHLNRTHTYIGAQTFAHNLLQNLSPEEILKNQKAIQELSSHLDWRQDFAALAQYVSDQKEDFEFLSQWNEMGVQRINKLTHYPSYILPILFFGILIWGIFSGKPFFNYLIAVIVLNLGLSIGTFKKIKKEIENSDRIDEITKCYGMLLEKIENQDFQSSKLIQLKNQVQIGNQKSSEKIQKLSTLFSDLNNIQNIFGALFLNGILFYHTHRFRAFNQWKLENATHFPIWLKTIGELESLNSLANLSYNNPEFCFPELNQDLKIEFEDLGHLLIHPSKRVCNDISFVDRPFTILTGSNMSGKSTFLRTLGINMVLGAIGSAICAKKRTSIR